MPCTGQSKAALRLLLLPVKADVSAHMGLQYFLRAPRFPVLIDLGDHLVGAASRAQCAKALAREQLPDTPVQWDVIDSSAENFFYYPKMSAISALATKKRWTKRSIIDLYNTRHAADKPAYESRSLGNKRFDQILAEIVELLNER